MLKFSPRFDLVIANYNKALAFCESFNKVKNFDLKKDRLIIMDCSVKTNKELKRFSTFVQKYKLQAGLNFLFVKRRNWNMNHGAQMDYVRLIAERKLAHPKFTFFMQDHYLNTKRFVKEDAIPAGEVIDLNDIQLRLLEDTKTIWFCSRKGFRISSRFKNINHFYNKKVWKKRGINSDPISLVIDGGNFCVRSEHLIKNFKNNPDVYTKGNGSFFFCHVWETRLSKIFYGKGFNFFEKHRNLTFKTIEDLLKVNPKPGKVWDYFFNDPFAYYLHGQDIYKSKLKFRYLWYILTEFRQNLIHDHNTKLVMYNTLPSEKHGYNY